MSALMLEIKAVTARTDINVPFILIFLTDRIDDKEIMGVRLKPLLLHWVF